MRARRSACPAPCRRVAVVPPLRAAAGSIPRGGARAALHCKRPRAHRRRERSSMAMLTLQLTAALIVCALAELGCAVDSAAEERWISPAEFFGEAEHNGGTKERLLAPAAGKKPHIWMLLFDDYGWADAGWHRDTIGPGGVHIPADPEVVTPNLNQMVKEGIELDRAYVYKYCSPTRSALQSGRNPYHVNPLNAAPNIANHSDPVSGFAAIPRNMTGIATKLSAAGYLTHSFGKWDAGMATPDHTPHGRGYRTAMNYFHHDNDYWSMVVGSCSAGPPPPPGPQESCDGELFKSVCLASSTELRATWTIDATACCAECAKEPECMGWAWGLTENDKGIHACHLKSKIHTPGNAGNCTSACKYTGCLQNSNARPVVDLWHMPEGGPEGPGHGYNNTCFRGQPNGAVDPEQCQPGPLGDHVWGGYEDALFEEQVMQVVEKHPPSSPLFLFWAPHIVHTPLQVPQHFLDKFAFMEETDKPTHNRQIYHAMVNFADEAVGNVTTAMKAKGLWDELIVVFSTDNGGPIYNNGSAGANNFPLKGGKMNNWEGGIRGNGFISGGFLPASRRGIKYEGLVTVWDNYATFCRLAGVDPTDHRAALAGLPPIDAVSHHLMILGVNITSPRTEIPIGTEPRASNITTAPLCSSYHDVVVKDDPLIAGDEPLPLPLASSLEASGRCTTVSGLIVDEGDQGIWKLLTGDVQQAVYMGPHYPNSTTDEISADFVGHCANGCLYNIKDDPLETTDVAAKFPARLAEMYKKLEAYETTAFNPHRGPVDPAACDKALGEYGGFWGWWIE